MQIGQTNRKFPWVDLVVILCCWVLASYILFSVKSFVRLTAVVEVVGADTVPRLIAYVLIILGLWLLISSIFLGKNSTTEFEVGKDNFKKAMLLLFLLGYSAVVPIIKFIPGTLLLGVFSLKLLGEQSWKTTFLVSISATLAMYFVFHSLLKVSLP
ncbi:MAG: hypothetical protein VR72_13075 [Clostridiaceae bacterium BRH_c20a]|nr:MAG: hypothetical protein VR72_13075 [Clostridiaceae bacterium BRH_c20a]